MTNLKRFFIEAIQPLISPIVRELPFMVLFFMLIVFRPVKFLLY